MDYDEMYVVDFVVVPVMFSNELSVDSWVLESSSRACAQACILSFSLRLLFLSFRLKPLVTGAPRDWRSDLPSCEM